MSVLKMFWMYQIMYILAIAISGVIYTMYNLKSVVELCKHLVPFPSKLISQMQVKIIGSDVLKWNIKTFSLTFLLKTQ